MTPYITAALFFLGLFSAAHALLNKRRPRAALGWIVCCMSIPGLGPLLYWSFGVNRVRTRARKLYRKRGMRTTAELRGRLPIPAGQLRGEVEIELTELVRTADIVTEAPLVPGNLVRPLFCGEEFQVGGTELGASPPTGVAQAVPGAAARAMKLWATHPKRGVATEAELRVDAATD